MKFSLIFTIATLITVNTWAANTPVAERKTPVRVPASQSEISSANNSKSTEQFGMRKRSRYTQLTPFSTDTDSIRLALRKKEEKWYC